MQHLLQISFRSLPSGYALKIHRIYSKAASLVLAQMASICDLIFSTFSLSPRASWYGIWASSLPTFLASFLLHSHREGGSRYGLDDVMAPR